MNNDEGYSIKRFNLDKDLYKDNGWFIIVTGKSRSGKGVYSANLIEKMIRKKMLHVKNAYLFSSSALVQKDSFPMIKTNRHTTYDDDYVNKIIEDNANIIKKLIDKGVSKEEAIRRNGILFVIDDLAGGEIHRSSSLLRLATAGRHVGFNVILLSQSLAASVNPRVRKNASIIVAYPSISHKVMRILCEEFGIMSLGSFSAKEARDFLMNLWKHKPYTCLVILQHKTDVRQFQDMIRFDRVETDIKKTTKYLTKHTLDNKKYTIPKENENETKSIFRSKKIASIY